MRKNLALVGGAAAATIAFSLIGAGQARADILPAENPPTITANGDGTFTWTYETIVTDVQRVENNNSFTLYDFSGFVRVASNPVNWTSSTALTGAPVVTPFGTVLPTDDPTLTNITFTYLNGPIEGGPTSLGLFSIVSTSGTIGQRRTFVGNGTDVRSGLQNGNVTNYLAPTTAVAPIPEPGEYAVMAMFGVGLVGLIARARRKSAVSGGLAAA